MNERTTVAALLALLALVDPGAANAAPAKAAAALPAKERVITLEVTGKGFEPADLELKAGEPVRLRITRRTDRTCAKEVVVPGYVEKTELPLNQPVEIAFTPKEAGSIRYGCAMGQMAGGVLTIR